EAESQRRLENARKEYEAAEKLEPGDVAGAEMLAALFLARLQDPVRSREVLDRVVAATADDPKKHAAALSVRYRYYYHGAPQPDLPRAQAQEALKSARADIEQAVKDDPKNADILVDAAEFSLQRRDTSAARQYLAAAPAEVRDNRRVRLVEGMIDLA